MFCGSCMHDNTWAHALMAAGCEVSLIPTYTPIRVDELDESLDRIFLGGINVYLNGRFGWWRHVPRMMTKWLDHPRIIRWATRNSISNDARELGALTLSMLQGEHGPHRRAVEELATFLAAELKPDVVIFSNALLAGALHEIKQQYAGPVLCVLQGDDVFLDALPEDQRRPVVDLVTEKALEFDRFLTHSRFYRDYMSEYLALPVDRFETLPLGIDLTGHIGEPKLGESALLTIGYFARIAPEKGLHCLVEAFQLLRTQNVNARLRVGGYLGEHQRAYFKDVVQGLDDSSFEYIGSPQSHSDKVTFLRSLDVLSVPTEFQEPKGLYILEALANGVPVVQPRHGAFPELIEQTGGGILVDPQNAAALAEGLRRFVNPSERAQFAESGWKSVRERYSSERMAARTVEIVSGLQSPPLPGAP